MIFKKEGKINSHGHTPTFINITEAVQEAVIASGIREGVAFILTRHTTCSIFFEEYTHDQDDLGDELLLKDLNAALKKIIPDQVDFDYYQYPGEAHFAEIETWPEYPSYLPNGDRRGLMNADAHIKATLLGSSTTVEVAKGKANLGRTGYIYFADFDRCRRRERSYTIIVMGE